ncbi:alpha/beta fold hydrolase [bacterium]|nr:alpha/beta fold hydrolase [bacterium]
MKIRTEWQPISLKGNEAGILLLHGFTGSPYELKDLARFLHESGYSVEVPLLPGHGTKVENLNHIGWKEWKNAAENHLKLMQEKHKIVFAGGLSMGAVLSLHLAANFDFRGVVAMSGATKIYDWKSSLAPFVRLFVSKFPKNRKFKKGYDSALGYQEYPVSGVAQLRKLLRFVRKELPQISMPALIVHSEKDLRSPIKNSEEIFQKISSSDKQFVRLAESGHVITVDHERSQVKEAFLKFVKAHE